MAILLCPNEKQPRELRKVYERAFSEATEAYLATAYLTEWENQLPLGPQCGRAVVLVGTDFGLTRKRAMLNMLRWAAKNRDCLLLAMPCVANRGFHPKLLVWKDGRGVAHVLVGSSNLSRAAFEANIEANVVMDISDDEYRCITEWLDGFADSDGSIPITEDWINHHYSEASLVRSTSQRGKVPQMLRLKLARGRSYSAHLKYRRRQQKAFARIAEKVERAARRCAAGKLTNAVFWETFWRLWSRHPSRFQGAGMERLGKSADWREACKTLVRVLDARRSHTTTARLDLMVAFEIDRLRSLRVPVWRAWLSEMLCHYLPNLYPLSNGPVRKWLKAENWRGRRGTTEGQRYVELARQLRYVLRDRPAGAMNLAELDQVIWDSVRQRRL
jgi:hypothetical protein